MTWTYSGDPAANDRDTVRFLIGDTNTNDQRASDEEIAWAITEEPGSLYTAAALVVRGIIAKYANLVDKEVGDLALSYSQRLDWYKALLADLSKKSSMRSSRVYAGGISITDKDAVEEDSDRVKPGVAKDMFSNPGRLSPRGTSDDDIWNDD